MGVGTLDPPPYLLAAVGIQDARAAKARASFGHTPQEGPRSPNWLRSSVLDLQAAAGCSGAPGSWGSIPVSARKL